MKPLKSYEIRQMWLDFFKSKKHLIIPSSSLVPYQDPTLLWINSGVAAIKSYFDGREIPTHRRLTNAQKSIRTNDIEQVGYTARHHTFFEMLGNFSIGDYFRKEAITWAYELLTSDRWFGFDLNKLYMTYSPLDIETKNIWMSLGVQEDHLIPLEGNFWEIGEGPCGPDTEIFYDRGPAYDRDQLGVRLLQEELPNDRYIEIWNIVFSQYQSVPGTPRESYKELPNKNIDTGSGLERLACIMQGTETNFETDLFYPLILSTEKKASIHYKDSGYRPYRVIADHIRTLTFALADGALFANEGRGYVLRRILRRAVRYARKIGIHEPFLYMLVQDVITIMEPFYPYLKNQKDRLENMIKAEEVRFIKTLIHGETLLKSLLDHTDHLDGAEAFKLYDTYGFPIELTVEIAQEQGKQVDVPGFELEMEKQKERARLSRQQFTGMNKQSADLIAFVEKSEFHYDPTPVTAKVIGLFKDGIQCQSIDDEGEVILDQTTFYAESGGQTFDIGTLTNATTLAEVQSVYKAPNKQHLHNVVLAYGSIQIGDTLTLNVNQTRRDMIAKNHSAVHLLQAALKTHLGSHILQQGSFVGDTYARFDFSHGQKISDTELLMIEKDVNAMIEANTTMTTQLLPVEEAKKTGATAPFDEKYGDIVRVVTLNERSKEFCGGTHVSATGAIGVFVIVSEESIASGTRRLVIQTATRAYEKLKQREQAFAQIRDTLKASSFSEVPDRLKAILHDQATLKVQLQHSQEQLGQLIAQQYIVQLKASSSPQFMVYEPLMTRPLLLKVIDVIKASVPQCVLVLVGKEKDSYPLAIYVSPGLPYQASTLMKTFASILGGSGGGKPDLALGATKTIDRLQEGFQAIK
jgi:alanyl-tRNA synthetase